MLATSQMGVCLLANNFQSSNKQLYVWLINFSCALWCYNLPRTSQVFKASSPLQDCLKLTEQVIVEYNTQCIQGKGSTLKLTVNCKLQCQSMRQVQLMTQNLSTLQINLLWQAHVSTHRQQPRAGWPCSPLHNCTIWSVLGTTTDGAKNFGS